MPKDVSALKVHARFSQSSFYAGQEVVCQIAISHEGNRETPSYSRWRSQAPSLATSRAVSPQRSSLHDQPNISRQSSTRLSAVLERGHRPTLSLGGASVSPSSASSPGGRVRAHQRSTSIIPDRTSPGPSRQSPNGAPGRRGPGVGHGRSASMQVGSRRASNLSTPTIGADRSLSPNNPPGDTYLPSSRRQITPRGTPLYQFPNEATGFRRSPSMPDRSPSPSEVASNSSSGFQHSVLSDLQERDALGIAAQNVTTKQGVGNVSLRDLHPALTRLRSQESVSNGSPRTSGDLYSSSNHSTETVASEYPSANLNRAGFRPSHQRFASTATITPVRGRSEHLLMGYASVNGSFTLDGGLVDQSHFEDIRAFGVVGGSGGGGVVGYEGQKAATGLLGGFGWGRISESLGGFLGKNEPSSIREMSYDSSNTGIPILSTPQSLLFVDQTLQPGQSQAYTFRFRLPESLPSSYRGRAIKIAYNLVVGIQRPADGGQQGFIKAEIPIRVLASTRPGDNNSVYDLREPTRLLRDTAVARSIDSTHSTYESVKTPQPDPPASKQPGKKDGLTDFLEYVKALQQHDDGAGGLLSPDASMPPTPSAGPFEGPSPFMPEQTGNSNARAIEKKAPELESPQTQFPAKQSLFTIKRADQFVATLHLSKAQYKLNDTLRLTLDFREPSPPASLGPTEKTPETFLNDPDTPSPTSTSSPPHSPHQSTSFPAQLLRPNSLKTFATAFTLLTSETVDPTLALRSKATTERLTRKIWAEGKEWVADCALTSWETVIGGTGKDAYPTIRTSAVGMQWQLKIAFTTEKPRLGGPQAALDGPGGRLPGSAGDRTSSGTLVSTEADRMHTFSRIDAALETDQFEVLIPVHLLPAEPEELAFAGDLVAETVGYGI